MIEIVQNLFKLTADFINYLFNFEIDLTPTFRVKVGSLVLAFVFFVLVIYFIFKIIGVGGDD